VSEIERERERDTHTQIYIEDSHAKYRKEHRNAGWSMIYYS